MILRPPFGAELRAALGRPGRSEKLGSSPRSRVWRIELPTGTAVLKQLVEGPGAEERYAREVSALRLAARAETPVVPALLAVDPAERVLVLEHLEHRSPPEGWIVGYAAALAHLHATTGPADEGLLPRWQGPDRSDADSFLQLADSLGVPVTAGVPGELHDLLDRLGRAPGQALLHGDPCPGNDLHTPAGIRFVDFEQASLGSGLTELAYLRVGFPTCAWVTAPAGHLLARAEEAYRREWRQLTGSAVADGLVDACAGWLLRGDALVPRALRDGRDHLARLAAEDWSWGTATARQRLAHRLGVVGRMAAGHPGLGGLSVLAGAMGRAARDRWPGLGPVPAQRPE
ncbi:aminoglycoside phosphotransferase family protein [Streptomyces sp. NPDC089919]|uniref:aminoglycoside phosphotransferase family protein n=1 Tax=Streptomyces sp. NPDC089919 TaxID=3155188 RepID=UPI003434D573